jgi:hypothetical protein
LSLKSFSARAEIRASSTMSEKSKAMRDAQKLDLRKGNFNKASPKGGH